MVENASPSPDAPHIPVLLRPLLSGVQFGGTDLGFWFAQQGSILVFLGIIFFYAWRMNKLDKEFGVDEE